MRAERGPSRNGAIWALIGLALAGVHLTFLAGIALFDNGHLVPDWAARSVWLVIAATPALLAVAGLRNRGFLMAAACISIPLMLISLAGATLPLILPAGCYFAGYVASDSKMRSRA